MNQKQIKTICYAVLFILGGLLTGCELEEDVIQKNAYRERLAIRNSTFEALSKEQPFVQALSGLNKGKHGKGSFSGTIMEAQYGFTILPDKAIVIEKEGKTSYTFQIVRETPDSTCFENLVIHTDNPGSTRAFIVKYTPEVPIVPSVTHESFYFSGAIRITPIEYNAELAGKKIVCVTATVMMCDQSWSGSGSTTPHVATQYCNNPNHLFEVTTTTCDMVAGGGSFGAGAGQYSGGDGMGGTGGGGGDGEPGNDDGLTPPNPCPRCPDFTTVPVLEGEEEVLSNCKKINKQLAKFPELKQKLINLAETTSENHENGIFIDKSATATSVNPIQNIPSGTAGIINIDINPAYKYEMLAHTHDAYGPDGNGTYSVFSWNDIATISRLVQNNHIDANEFVFYVFTADGTRYAMTIDCVSCLKEFHYYPFDQPVGTVVDTKRLMKMKMIKDKYYEIEEGSIKVNSNPNDDKKAFLNFIKEANLGISLFEINADFTTLEKLEVDSKGVVKNKPCTD
ncbi:hypothetical protein [Flavobacterium inviolabile]|uniref:hypothetical protein n=1 Tax=Flavobacterium inviolabile TaxID=2748320 RepID=UPI0015AF4EB7|nr:hypothetical protein [Flavobacterium inviolabile]